MTTFGFIEAARRAALSSLIALPLAASPVMAQDEQQPAPKQQAAPQKKSGGGGGDRIAKVEAQLVDLQVALGSIESLVRNGGGASMQQAPAPAPSSYDAGGGGAGDGRVAALETQIQALTAQLEQMTQQMAALQSRLGGGSGGVNAPMPGNGGNAPPAQYIPNSYDAPAAEPRRQDAMAQPNDGNPAQDSRASFDHQASFGQQGEPQREVAQAGMSDPIGGMIGDGDRAAYGDPSADSSAVAQPPRNLAALPLDAGAGAPAADPSGANPKEIYDVAYRQLMAREYDSAAASFSQFVSSYPTDPLAGEAQYWLGETYYVRGQHKQAADAFLASYRTYGSGRKAPDSLLKLGLALAQLKEKDAACSALSEFSVKYPSAPEHLRTRAASERRRAGCS